MQFFLVRFGRLENSFSGWWLSQASEKKYGKVNQDHHRSSRDGN